MCDVSVKVRCRICGPVRVQRDDMLVLVSLSEQETFSRLSWRCSHCRSEAMDVISDNSLLQLLTVADVPFEGLAAA